MTIRSSDALDGGATIRSILADALSPSRAAGGREEIVALLRQQSPIYAGRTSADAGRLRGTLLVGLAAGGLPASAMPFVLEDLATGQDPFGVAAAARALRASEIVPDGVADLLLDAVERMRGVDDVVRFEIASTTDDPSSALKELFRAFAWMGARAAKTLSRLEALRHQDPPAVPTEAASELAIAIESIRDARPLAPCCSGGAMRTTAEAGSLAELAGVQVQDQDGAIAELGSLTGDRRSVVAFFYTRCPNPEKCSLTIAKLGSLRRRLDAVGRGRSSNVLGLTYDPGFDLPGRLHSYGAARGMSFNDHTKLLRTTGDFRPLSNAMELGVGYGPSTVNQHGLELIILDERCRVETVLKGPHWSEDDVLRALAASSATPSISG